MIRYTFTALRWPVALTVALYACGVPALRFDATSPPASGLTCAQSCAARLDAGCLEPALASRCEAVCEHIRDAGLVAPVRCRP